MGKYSTTTLLLVFISSLAWAQKTKIQGHVLDSLQQPLELANIMAFNAGDSSVASFGSSDSDGAYSLILKAGQQYLIKGSYIGYDTYEATLTAQGQQMEHNIYMRESVKKLNAVEIVYEFPITISGDTISYKTDAFSNGKERKLGGLLENLPGFEVDDNGEVKVQGKKVNKVLVEGKEFFDGDTKMATKNIPANAIDKVQVLRNYNDVSPMGGAGNNEQIALNIKLKDGKKSMWFGDVELGGGPDARYLAHPNLFYYSPKTSFNFIGDLNNIGEQAFSMSDYFRFTGGMKRRSGQSGASFTVSSDDMGLSMMQNNMAYNVDSKLGALNFTHYPNNKWSFSGFGIGSFTDTKIKTRSLRSYVKNQDNNVELTASNVLQQSKSGLLKIGAKHTPNANTHIEMETFVKGSSIQDKDNRVSTFGATDNNLLETNQKTPFRLDQTLAGYFNLNKKNILAIEANYQYREQVPDYFLDSENKPFDGVLPLLGDAPYSLFQNTEITTNNFEMTLDHYWLINKKNHLNFKAGTNVIGQKMVSSITQVGDNGAQTPIEDPIFANNLSLNYQDWYLGAQYKTIIGDLTVSPGIKWHNYQIKDVQKDSENPKNKTLWQPELYARYAFSSSNSLTLDYGVFTQFADVQNLAMGTTISNYNSLYVGNRNLQNAFYHNLNLSYYNFNMFNHTNFYLMGNYQKRKEDIIESVVYNNSDRLSAPTNSIGWNEMAMGNASFEKKYTRFRYQIEAQLQYALQNNTVELQENTNSNFAQNYTISAETNFPTLPNIEAGFKKGWNQYKSSNSEQLFVTNAPFVNIEASFLKNFILIVEYEYTDYRSQNTGTSTYYDFLNTTLYYQKAKSPWEFKLQGNNLLQTETIRRDSFNNNLMSTFEYFVQPQYFILTAKYNL